MSALSLALPGGVDPELRSQSTARAYQAFHEHTTIADEDIRPLVLDSWRRSTRLQVDPETDLAPVTLVDDALNHARDSHPLHRVMPVVHELLVKDAEDAGVVVVVGDADGNVLWVDGDRSLIQTAERVHLLAGARWSERDVGTNGIGTALELGSVVQVFGSEHYSRHLHDLSCTAATIRDPRSGSIVGFFDISGGPQIATPQAAFLARTAVAAIEAELRLLDRSAFRATRQPQPASARLSVLGRERGVLVIDGRPVELSVRHSELVLLLATRPEGLTVAELAWQLYERDAAEVTIRAEMSRLRKSVPHLIAAERPYRLAVEVRSDADDVADALRSGSVRRALDLYRGAILPRSTAPGIEDLRAYLRGFLRESVLRDGDAETLLRYAHTPAGQLDLDVWHTALKRLPAGSPRRAEATAVVNNLHQTLGVQP